MTTRHRALAGLLALAALLLLAVGVVVGRDGGATPVGLPVDGRVVLVGAPGLAWSDVEPAVTPTLARLADGGAVGSLTVRAVRSRSCAVDGWLTLSAGRRAADAPGKCRAPTPPAPDGTVPRWDTYLAAADESSFDARPGLLGERAEAAGACVEAVGAGAAVGAATPDGRVARWSAELPPAFSCPVALVDGGVLPADASERRAALGRLDDLVRRVLEGDPAATVLVAGVGDGGSRVVPRLAVAGGANTTPGLLTSPSTRQAGAVQLQDLTATLLDAVGAPVDGLTGRPVEVAPSERSGADRVEERVGFEVRAATMRAVSPQVTGALAVGFALWAAVVAVCWSTGRRLPAPVHTAGAVLAVVSVSTFVANVVPWWRTGTPTIAFLVVLTVVVAALAAAAVGAARRRRMGGLRLVAVVTLVVLAADVLTGSRLQLGSVFGQNPVVGGRFYGLGNTSFALYGLAVLVLVQWVAGTARLGRRAALGSATALLVVALALEAAPAFGADFGGPPGLLLGGAVLLAGAAGIRITPARALVGGIGAALLVGTVAWLDWLRPPADRTHLGDAVQTVLDGGLGDVVSRKVAQNVANLGSPPLITIALATAVIVTVAVRTGARLDPAAALVVKGAAVMATVGFAVNDSGLVIPAFVALVLVPLLVADGSLAVGDDGGQWPAAGSTSSTSTPPASLGWMKFTRDPLVPRRGLS